MPTPAIEAYVGFGGIQYSHNDVLGTLTHIRGWDLPTSYAIIELHNPHTEVLNEFMNYGKVTIKYGKDGGYVGPITMEIFSVGNEIAFSNVKVRLVVVEPGFVRLTEKNKIKSYPNQTVAEVVGQLASEAGLRTSGIKQTTGSYTFTQPNMSDLAFMSKYLVPIATDSSRTAPYLFTIDNNTLHLRPPNLNQEPRFKFILDPSKDTVVKRFTVKNTGVTSDMVVGSEYKTYGYDFTQKGNLTHTDFTTSVNPTFLSKKPYESDYMRTRVMPYPEQWMLDAHNRNSIAKGQFCVSAEAPVVGENELLFDQIYQFTALSFQNEPTEYSGRYYVQSIATTIEKRLYLVDMKLHTNSFLKGEDTKAPKPEQPSARVRGSTGGLPVR